MIDSPAFESDGCTGVPDMIFYRCCVKHDWRYDTGGTEADRLAADIELRECMKARALVQKGAFMRAVWWLPQRWVWFYAVRIFGRSHFTYKE